jgi:hypothetical protein
MASVDAEARFRLLPLSGVVHLASPSRIYQQDHLHIQHQRVTATKPRDLCAFEISLETLHYVHS